MKYKPERKIVNGTWRNLLYHWSLSHQLKVP